MTWWWAKTSRPTTNIKGVLTLTEVRQSPVFYALSGKQQIIANNPPAAHSQVIDPPLAAPKLTLTKEALGDGVIFDKANQRISTIINDGTGAYCDYKLSYRNDAGGGVALGVKVRDYVPEKMTFNGFLEKNGSTVPSLVGYKFYDSAGKEMKIIGAEGYTDSNGNGFYDVGETFNDANGNKKYDGVTAKLVRSMDLPAGDLAGGSSGHFVYQTKTISVAGITIVSNPGRMVKVQNGLDFAQDKGYHLTATNLHFPVNGPPPGVKVQVTSPAVITAPVGTVKSRSTLADSESITLSIPYEVTGALGVALSGIKMETIIPKGFQVALAQVLNTAGQVVQKFAPGAVDNTFTIGAPDAKGVRKLIFPLGSDPIGFPLVKLNVDPATKAVLKNSAGETKAPLVLDSTVSGSYQKPSGSRSARGVATNPILAMAKFPVKSVVPVQTDTLKDARIFVGRCAPASVRRGDTFSYTIFVGNLTNLGLGLGTVVMDVPDGCEYVDASLYKYNYYGADSGLESTSTWPEKPKRNGKQVRWEVGSFFPRECGAVTLTVKVLDSFTGTRIDENNCIFDTQNSMGKSSGPIGVVVRAGNATTQASEITQSATSGLLQGLPLDVPINWYSFAFAGDTAPLVTTFGGADLLQLTNGVTLVQIGGGRVLAVGPPSKIQASGVHLVKDDALVRVAVGSGDSGGVQVSQLPVPTFGSQPTTQAANTVLANLHIAASSLVAAGGGNLVAAGGGNMVAAGGGNLIGNDGSTLTTTYLIGNDGSTFTSIQNLVAAGGGNLIGNDGSTLVAAGGGNLVAAGGGNIVAVGAGHLIGNDGSTLVGNDGASLVAAGGGNLIGQDGSTLVAAGGGNLVAAGGGNLIFRGGAALLPNLR